MAAANNYHDPDDWVAEVLHTTDPTITQADYLPATTVTFRKLQKTLENGDQFYDWDKDLRDGAENGQNWKKMSLTVAHWMKDNISNDLRQKLERRYHPNKLLFADTTYAAIVELVEGTDSLGNCVKLYEWLNVMASEFFSTSEYIDNLVNTAARMKYHGIGYASPPSVMRKILQSLDNKPEWRIKWKPMVKHINDDECIFTDKYL
ncbi:hypothetical protein N7540_011431 [Penicillium herquei]|nr:hypothetical protein N7540_011431 [Penicillium herquei]